MWKEQREDAKQRKGGGGRASAAAGARGADTGEERNKEKGNGHPPQVHSGNLVGIACCWCHGETEERPVIYWELHRSTCTTCI